MPHGHKNNMKSLKELHENEGKKTTEKSKLFESNPLLHANADNENFQESAQQAWDAIPGSSTVSSMFENARDMLNESETGNVLSNTINDFQDNMSRVISLQRRVAQLWMKTWLDLALTPVSVIGSLTVDSQNLSKQAPKAS